MSPLDSNALEAGRIYKSTGGLSTNMLRSPVYRAWERSHLQGANPYALKTEQLSSLETERLVEKHRFLIDAIQPYFRILSQAAGKERHAIMLSEGNAILLDVVGDERTLHGLEPFPIPGSLLSEAVAGANGIGTTLVEEDYAEIIAAEHFIDGFHPFTCQGIPLRNDKREIMGVLSISLRSVVAGQRLKEILLCAAHGIEAELLIANLEKDVRRVLTSNPEDYQPLEELRQDIVQAHHAARLKLEAVSRLVVVNRLDYALELLKQAEKSIQLFRHRANIWRNLASFEIGTKQAISLTDSITNLVDILTTESAIRQIEVVTSWQEPITVIADPRSLLRKLLRYFLQAFESVGKGGRVEVSAEKILNSEVVQISFTLIPGLNIVRETPKAYYFSLPIAHKNDH
jgi:sigma-54 dependent transcriptional regulator, acetoin dehydrogenase operon transcriptional activator AcoR